MSTMLAIGDKVIPQDIFDGSIVTLPPTQEVFDFLNHARKIAEQIFDSPLEEIETKVGDDNRVFIERATATKTAFTDGEETQVLMKKLIASRYSAELLPHMIYDKPRLRIIPNSKFLSAGISYNYKPHRETWYGHLHEQINHWMPLCNASADSTFYLSMAYFNRPVKNNSDIFDLDTWDQKFRKTANEMIGKDDRPHPVPSEDIPKEEQYLIVMPAGYEIAFSGHHLHGSAENTTNKVRFSLDYRTVIQLDGYTYPANIDSRATGDLKKYMLAAI